MTTAIPTVINDPASDSVYLLFVDTQVDHSVELNDHVVLDVDQYGTIVGIDIQYFSSFGPEVVAMTPDWSGAPAKSEQMRRRATGVEQPVSAGRRMVLQPA